MFKKGHRGAVLDVRRQSIPQSVGAATEKDLAPYVFKLKCGIERRSFEDERS